MKQKSSTLDDLKVTDNQ